MFCSKCGTALFEGAAFCTVCGEPTGNVTNLGIGSATPAGPMVSAAGAVTAGPLGAAPVPAIAPSSAVATTVAPSWPSPHYATGVLYAGFWLRVVAAIIDGIVVGIPFVPFMFVIFSGMMPMLTRSPNPQELLFALLPRLALLIVFSQIVGWLYWSLMESSGWQATLGKKALGLYVTDLAGNRASFGRTSGRYCAGRLVSIVPYIGGLYFLVDCICAGLTERKQAIHDIISGCLVLRKA
jgi:uncharacterized RDD family membrane protein YckC